MDGFWFKSTLFDIEPGEDDEVNPRIYGRQLAEWLKQQLESLGYQIEPVIAEDWGRCLMCSRAPFMLWVGCGSDVDDDELGPDAPPPSKENIVWYCFPMAEVPIWRRIFRKPNTAPSVEKLSNDLAEILQREPSVTLVPRP